MLTWTNMFMNDNDL